ncbi:hypothetical protein NHX12_018477 [Muraenolepis orangiensis]|uniref:Peroxisomal ATPase PEX6 n=1 Tax=Muraenolepis orangiensis TaxID=630683 RepID=A0A9Q0IYI6_9TELE|nr:hypothetical protein NHX12_018477 [Muraenolepis orangiensis]
MAARVVLSCLDPFPTHINLLDVLVDKVYFEDAFHTDSVVVVLFTAAQPDRRSSILLCAHPSPNPNPYPEARSPPVQLLVSRLFLQHHDLQNRAAGSVRLVSPSSLSEVVVGARSNSAFKWASSAQFSSGLQGLAADGRPLLAREGAELLLPFHPLFGEDQDRVQQLLLDLMVLSCSPVRQGRITAGTCIVVSDLSESPGGLSLAKPRTSNLKVFVSDFAHLSDSLSRSSSLLANKKVLKSGFSGFLPALEGRVEVRVANLLPLLRDPRLRGQDLDSTVLVSNNLLMKLGLFNHEWVVLSEVEQHAGVDASPPRRGRLASLLALDLPPSSLELHLNDSFGLVSTTHWFNLSGGKALPSASRTLRVKRWNESSELQASPSSCSSASPHFASHLHVDPVRSRDYDAHRCYDSMLAHHFTTARLVSPGDVLSVSAEEYTGERWVVLYFKVTKVFASGEDDQTGVYLADNIHTSLYTGGYTSSRGPRGCGKRTSVKAACRRLHLQLLEVQCVSLCGDTAAACEVKMRTLFKKAQSLQPCLLLLRNLQYLRSAREGADKDSRVSVESPNEDQREAMLASLTLGLPLGREVNLQHLAKITSGLVLCDLGSLLAEAGRTTAARLKNTCVGQLEEDLCSSGVKVQLQDFLSALETLQDKQAQAVGAPKIPSVRWQEVGGLQEVKDDILDTVQLPLQRPELMSLGLHRVGLLLYGPPGTGKTLLAKAVATECSMTFLSEENIREVFSRARAAAPCVVFFDELDSLAPSRGRSGDSGGVMDRVVSQLLAELDGLHSIRGVFVIGATNRPDLLDQALLRPGRFDKLVYVGMNSDRESQLQVLKAITAKFHLEPGVSLELVVDACPRQLTGADLYALCSEAMTAAIRRKIGLINDGLDTEDSPVLLSSEDFDIALKNIQPSVSDQELLKYQDIQQKLTAK